jgi:hypothetical protein
MILPAQVLMTRCPVGNKVPEGVLAQPSLGSFGRSADTRRKIDRVAVDIIDRHRHRADVNSRPDPRCEERVPRISLQGYPVIERGFDVLEHSHIAVAEALDPTATACGNQPAALTKMRFLHLSHRLIAEIVGKSG